MTPINILASDSQTWIADYWYQLQITWQTGGTISGELYESNGTTLLNSLTATATDITSGASASAVSAAPSTSTR